jgi:hypothetical protein
MERDIDIVWQRIVANAGQTFHQIKGQAFTYTVNGQSIRPSTTNQLIGRTEFEKALEFVPLTDTTPIQHLRAPSYLYAILMDERISHGLWQGSGGKPTDTEQKAKLLWSKIVSSLRQNPHEIETIKLDRSPGIWFSASVENNAIVVDNAVANAPSAIIRGARMIFEDEFIKVFTYYEPWINRRCPRGKIRNKSMNTSYIFALIHHYKD